MNVFDSRAIVAIDPTTRGIAFVFFENGLILDWGERRRPPKAGDLESVDAVLDACAADVLVIEDPSALDCKRRPRIRSLLRSIAEHARRRNVVVLQIARQEVKHAWSARGVKNKEAVASELAACFTELTAILPPRRKAGANEDPRVNIFDAVSLVAHVYVDPASLAR